MGKAFTALWALTIVLVGASGAARADFTVASNLPSGYSLSSFDIGIGFQGNTSNGFFTNEAPAQEFTASASGILTTLLTTVDQFQPGGVSLNVSIRAVSGGVPGTLLGSVLFTPSQVSPNGLTTLSNFDLSSANIIVTAGQSYVVTYTVDTPPFGSVRYRALLTSPHSYSFN